MESHINNKYYVPEINEFYVGFEFEIFENDNWKTVNFNIDDIIPIFARVNGKTIISDKIRVKYLDKEDIESLGWKLKTDLYIKDNLTLQVHKDLITIKYYDNFNNEWRPKVEQIIIKNKSELIKLLKQLGIG